MADSKMAKAKLGEFLTAVSADHEVYGPKADHGVVTFPLGANLVLGPGVPQYILVVYDLNGNAWIDETFRAGLESSVDIAAFSGTTGAAAVVTGAPVDGNDIKVKFGE